MLNCGACTGVLIRLQSQLGHVQLSPQMPKDRLGLEELFLAWNWGRVSVCMEMGRGPHLFQIHRMKISRVHPCGLRGEWRRLRLILGFKGAE